RARHARAGRRPAWPRRRRRLPARRRVSGRSPDQYVSRRSVRQAGLGVGGAAAAQDHVPGTVRVEAHPGQLPTGELSLDRQLRRRVHSVDIGREPQRRVFVAHGPYPAGLACGPPPSRGRYPVRVRLGPHVGHLTVPTAPADTLALVREAERLGYAVVWAAEAYGSDSPSLLAWLAGQTSRIELGSAVMQIPARAPAATAMTAVTIDALSGGRFRLGLGVSGPQVSEGWHGVPFADPLGRTREYVEIVRMALARQRVSYTGRHWQLPLPGGAGKALKLNFRPPREKIPIYLAALGPRNLRLTGEIADGWLAIFFAPEHAGEQLDHLRAGAGGDLSGFDVVAAVPVVIGEDVTACA